MMHTTHTHKDVAFYTDVWGEESLKVNHAKGTFVTLKNNSYTMSLSRFHRAMVEKYNLQGYGDITLQEYIDRTSDKKLKAQGLKRI